MRSVAITVSLLLCLSMEVQGQDTALLDSLVPLRSSPFDTVQIDATLALSWYYSSSNLDTARLLSEQALERSHSFGYHKGQANAFLTLARIDSREGKYQRSIDYSEKGLAIFRKLGDYKGQFECLNGMAICKVYESEYTQALSFYEAAMQIADSVGDTDSQARVYNNLGHTYTLVGAYPEALELVLKSKAISEQYNYPLYLALNYYNLGNIYRNTQRMEEAKSSFKEAVKRLKVLGNKFHLGLTYRDLGRTYAAQDSLLEAKQAYQTCLNYFNDVGNELEMSGLLLSLGRLEQAIGNQKGAEAFFNRALEKSQLIKEQKYEAQAFIELGRMALAKGNYSITESRFKQGLGIAERIGGLEEMKMAYIALADLYAAQSEFDKSYQWLSKYTHLNDSLNSAQNQDKINQLTGAYQLSKKQLEINRMEQSREIEQVKNQRDRGLLISLLFVLLALAGGSFLFLRLRYLRSAQAQLVAIATASPLPLSIIRWKDGHVIYVNEMFSELTGYSLNEMINKPAGSFYSFTENHRSTHRQVLSTKGNIQGTELSFIKKDGTQFWALVSSRPGKIRGERVAIFGFLDITLRRQIEFELRESKGKTEAAFTELKSARAQLALSEKLASLGELVAGIAHEINTPLGAVKSSAQTLSDMVPKALEMLGVLRRQLGPELAATLELSLTKMLQRRPMLSSKEERALRKKMGERLVELDIEDGVEYARLLVEAGIYEIDEPTELLLKSSKSRDVVEALHQIGLVYLSIENVMIAADKTTQLVRALKRYTHTTQAEAPEPVSLQDNIHTILILYAYQIRQKAELVVSLENEATVLANGDKLGQIWTNLITNSLQAMDGRGVLKVELAVEANHATVMISDTGKGIPPDVLPRIFDPFYTTKPKGEGTGMGLHICRQIVESYSGTMSVASQPGSTIFTVRLPLHAVSEPVLA